MLNVGRVCIKIAGRDAGKTVVVIDTPENNFVMIDGQTKRKRCNIHHLEPTTKQLEIKKSASHADIVKALENLDTKVTESKSKTKKNTKPKKQKVEKKAGKEGKEAKKKA